MVGCYAILALLATAPHPHDLRAAAPDARIETAVREASGPAQPSGQGNADRAGCCSLCSWSRIPVKPAQAAVIHEIDATPPAGRIARSITPATTPQTHPVLLRAPPAA